MPWSVNRTESLHKMYGGGCPLSIGDSNFSPYITDWILVLQFPQQLQTGSSTILQLLIHLGLRVNVSKSLLLLVQMLLFVGVQIHIIPQQVYFPLYRAPTLCSLVRTIIATASQSAQSIQLMLGLRAATTFVTPIFQTVHVPT